ncbi:hypothetical protein EYZ11_012360 [Aspergillus tanneri]|uniref:Uncharacterized protein n=1 Tax=Aspergillus tanneri TaxID=1220188 RepID=A0A4V3UMQ1_9EURO|nr:hypothetical protein EYZ11_012360 [Aspergillus tanneri]
MHQLSPEFPGGWTGFNEWPQEGGISWVVQNGAAIKIPRKYRVADSAGCILGRSQEFEKLEKVEKGGLILGRDNLLLHGNTRVNPPQQPEQLQM